MAGEAVPSLEELLLKGNVPSIVSFPPPSSSYLYCNRRSQQEARLFAFRGLPDVSSNNSMKGGRLQDMASRQGFGILRMTKDF